MKSGLVFCITLISFGLLDLVTTLVGVTFFGAAEVNPLLAGILASNPLVFGCIKLVAVTLIGFMFHRAGNAKISGPNILLGNRILQVSYSFVLIFLTTVVTNNLIVVAKLA